jgi:hypothetical protein
MRSWIKRMAFLHCSDDLRQYTRSIGSRARKRLNALAEGWDYR